MYVYSTKADRPADVSPHGALKHLSGKCPLTTARNTSQCGIPSLLEALFEARRFGGGKALAWVARETSKPGRTGPEAWVVHANPAWSRTNIDLTLEHSSARSGVWCLKLLGRHGCRPIVGATLSSKHRQNRHSPGIRTCALVCVAIGGPGPVLKRHGFRAMASARRCGSRSAQARVID